MQSLTDGRCRSQISFLRQQFLQRDGLPFCDVLSAKTLSQALATIEGGWVDRVYTPLTTLWVFLGQVLSADHSCRAAVVRLIAHRVACGQRRCSAETAAYCRRGNDCPSRSSPQRPARRDVHSTRRPRRSGSGRGGVSTSTTARPSRFPTRPRIRPRIPGQQPAARSRVPDRPYRGRLLALVRGDPRPRRLPLRRQEAE